MLSGWQSIQLFFGTCTSMYMYTAYPAPTPWTIQQPIATIAAASIHAVGAMATCAVPVRRPTCDV